MTVRYVPEVDFSGSEGTFKLRSVYVAHCTLGWGID